MIFSAEYVRKSLNVAPVLCSIFLWVSNRTPELRWQSIFLEIQDASHLQTVTASWRTSALSPFLHVSVSFLPSPPSSTRVMSAELWWISRWVATEYGKDRVALISNTSSLMSPPPWCLIRLHSYTLSSWYTKRRLPETRPEWSEPPLLCSRGTLISKIRFHLTILHNLDLLALKHQTRLETASWFVPCRVVVLLT